MQAEAQRHIDSSISKTVNVPTDFPFDRFESIYRLAYERGLKGCTTFRPGGHLEGVLVRSEDRPAAGAVPAPAAAAEGVVAAGSSAAAAPPSRRPGELGGTTYKVRTPVSREAFYVTINDIDDGGRRRPYEIFINTKNLQHYSWIVAMTRLISAIFRRERDPAFLVEELKSIHDPEGGYFSGGEYVPSLAAEIGRVIARHLRALGLMAPEPESDTDAGEMDEGTAVSLAAAPPPAARLPLCPACNQPRLVMQEGCKKCLACGYSKCG